MSKSGDAAQWDDARIEAEARTILEDWIADSALESLPSQIVALVRRVRGDAASRTEADGQAAWQSIGHSIECPMFGVKCECPTPAPPEPPHGFVLNSLIPNQCAAGIQPDVRFNRRVTCAQPRDAAIHQVSAPEPKRCAGLEGCHELEGVMYDLFVHDPKCPKGAEPKGVNLNE